MMRAWPFCLAAWMAVASGQPPETGPAADGAQFGGETLSYTVNWPSGLSLGEARMEAGRMGEKWKFELLLDAAVPGFAVSDSFTSLAAPEFCSLEFAKVYQHGKRKANEKTVFDLEKGTATRQTLGGGGKSEFAVPACARDALAFLYFLRRELRSGRLPPPQTIYFGAAYELRLQYGGAQQVRVDGAPVQADRLTASLKGPASDVSFELFFARDEARTPVLIRAPFAIGTFTMELVR